VLQETIMSYTIMEVNQEYKLNFFPFNPSLTDK